jgi:thiamine biosynthesis lipoprotein
LEGKRVFHILDPRTGYPAASGIASVTVVAANSMTADALATTLSVLKPALGMDLLEKHFPQAQAMFILRQADGFKTLRTDRFPEPQL